MRGSHVLLRTAVAVCVLLAAHRAYADDDIVFLKSGGRVRGVIVVEDPKTGVRIKLADGTIRSVAHAEVDHVQYAGAAAPEATPGPAAAPIVAPVVAPVAPPPPVAVEAMPTGRLVVKATIPGKVYLDRGMVGHTPFEMPAAVAGFHRVTVEFDGGGSSSQLVTVIAGQTNEIELEPSGAAAVFTYRKGVHLGATVDGLAYVINMGGVGGGAMPFVNIGLTPVIDLRFGGAFTYSDAHRTGSGYSGGLTWSLGADASLRLNFGPIYTMAFGARVGYASTEADLANCVSGTAGTAGAVGPSCSAATKSGGFLAGELSPATFRFGSRGEFEAGYTAAIEAIPGSTHAWLRNDLSFTYLFTQF